MSRAPAKPKQLACLTIGHYHYLLPSASAMKVAELMQEAQEVDHTYEDSGFVYTVREEQPKVAFALVRPNQLRMPHAEAVPVPAPRQRLLK